MSRESTIYKPLREIKEMRRDLDRFWDGFLDERPRKMSRKGGHWFPSVDVSETKKEIIVKAELPGMSPKDIDISFSEGCLTIRGEKKQEREENGQDYRLHERSYGSFIRLVPLPTEVIQNKASASYRDGVLRITLPKSEEARSREIKIEVE